MSISAIWLAFDFGHARTGVAIGQSITGDARPLTVLRRVQGNPDWQTIDTLIQQWKPTTIVVGRPQHADGKSSKMTKAAESFAATLSGRYDMPVVMHDERLTSKIAESEFADARRAGKAKAKDSQQLDAMAACIILESWINEHKSI